MATPESTPPLTASAIKALSPREEAYELGDGGCAGLRLRVEPTGRRVFRWYTRDGGKRTVVTIGPWSERGEDGVTLAEARRKLGALKAARADGRLLSERRGLEASATGVTLAEVAVPYFEHLRKRRKSAEHVIRSIERSVLPALGNMAVARVTPRDVRAVVEELVNRGSPSQADHVFDDLKGLLRFAQGRGEIDSNPAAVLDPDALGCETQKRQRALSDAEIAAWWAALDRGGFWASVRAGLRLLLLVGCRSGELLRAEWSEFDLAARTWTVPSVTRRSAGDRRHTRGRGVSPSRNRRWRRSSASGCSPRAAST